MEDQTQTKTKDKEANGSGLGKTMMSHYFLSASDNPGTIITQVQLRGTNYDEWARAMRTALCAKKKFSFVHGTVKQPANDSADLEDWWMLLWDDIKERFSVGNGPRVQQLKSELANCKQQGAKWDKKRDEEKLHQFLMGLDEAMYGGVQLMTRAKEERSEPVAFVVQAAQGSCDNRDKSFVLCTHCNKTGYEASSCFQLIGYPEWWGERPKATRNAGRGHGNSRHNGGNNGHGRGGSARATLLKSRHGLTIRLENSRNQPQAVSSERDSIISETLVRPPLYLVLATELVIYGIEAKQCRENFVLSNNKASDIFELIHCDLRGPHRTACSCGAHYFLTIVDDLSHGVWTYLLIVKNEVGRVLRNFLSIVSRQFHKLVKIIRTDNGTEFMYLSDFFVEHGIHHQTTCGGTSQQNGRVECKHRHILNVARALRFQAFLPIEFWGECVLTACDLINRTPSVLLDGQTSYERLFGKAPFYENIWSFGCLAYAYNCDHRGDKFASRSRCCIFMGYPFGKKGWYLYDLESDSFFTSRDVTFVEHDFPYKALTEPAATATPTPEPDEPVLAKDLSHDLSAPVVSPYSVLVASQDTGDALETINTPSPVPTSLTLDEHASDDMGSIKAVETSLQQQPALGRHLRQRQQSIKLKDHVLHIVQHLSPSSRPSSCSHAQSLPAAITAGVQPASFAEANKQVEGIDYTETFAPVAKLVIVQTFLAVAAAMNWELHHMDVHNALLHDELNEEVYMRLPPGFTSNESGMVCRLRKSLYGLKQAPRCWLTKLAAALKTYGFAQLSSDYSLFTLHRDSIHLLVLVYVDDIIVSGNNSEAIRVFKMYLSDCFYMKDLGPLKYFLGIEVARNPIGIFLSQRKYVLDIISEDGLLGAKPAPFPLEPNHQLALAEGPYFSDPAKYQRLVGRLIYLSAARPKLSYSVHLLSQFMQQPWERHWEAALPVVHYLKVITLLNESYHGTFRLKSILLRE
ncbi:hypothetical protein KPL71_023424 [Citrus sinensis]|uniref:Uncharacterized protein n=1 Tax=Citrus sinensis TaxID=2711 RepID=A0ACB8IJ50_CITSI|nr:hypothetical protein KPL71_023424 [Citrus sinensis]